MSKVYILLRNNKQTGPYSLEDLVQFGLKPYDLVWVEGKTACWLYPSEINELKPYAPQKKEEVQTKPKQETESQPLNSSPFQPVPREDSPVKQAAAAAKVYVSLPSSPAERVSPSRQASSTPILEQRAEELRQRVLAQATEAKIKSEVDASAVKSLEQKAEELRNRAMAQATEAKIKSEVDASAVKSLEQKAEELRNRALAQATEAKIKSEVDASAVKSLEQKAEDLRNRAMAQAPEAKIKSEVDASATRSLEQKAEEIRQRAMAAEAARKVAEVKRDPLAPMPASPVQNMAAAAPKAVATPSEKAVPAPEFIQTKYARSLDEVESDYTSWIYRNKSKANNKLARKAGAIGVAALLLVLCFGGIYFAFFSNDNAGKDFTVVPTENAPAEAPASSSNSGSAQTSPTGRNALPTAAKGIHQANNEKTISDIKNDPARLPATAAHAEKDVKEKVADHKRPAPVVNNQPLETAVKKPQDIAVNLPAAKKTATEKTIEPTRPGTTDIENGERKARRRGDEAATTAAIATPPPVAAPAPVEKEKLDLTSFIDLISSESPGNWMMGVRGIKLTLLNRSQEMVKQARIEVRYYNEHEEILEKKIVNVQNIQGERSVLVAVPDHRLADHADYRLLSATN